MSGTERKRRACRRRSCSGDGVWCAQPCIDAIVMQNTNDWLGCYVKWLKDGPSACFHRTEKQIFEVD
jgi:hypothetical protein